MTSRIQHTINNFDLVPSCENNVVKEFKQLSRNILKNIYQFNEDDQKLINDYSNLSLKIFEISKFVKIFRWYNIVQTQYLLVTNIKEGLKNINSGRFLYTSDSLKTCLQHTSPITLSLFCQLCRIIQTSPGTKTKASRVANGWIRVLDSPDNIEPARNITWIKASLNGETLFLPPSHFAPESPLWNELNKALDSEEPLILQPCTSTDTPLVARVLQNSFPFEVTKSNVENMQIIGDFYLLKKIQKEVKKHTNQTLAQNYFNVPDTNLDDKKFISISENLLEIAQKNSASDFAKKVFHRLCKLYCIGKLSPKHADLIPKFAELITCFNTDDIKQWQSTYTLLPHIFFKSLSVIDCQSEVPNELMQSILNRSLNVTKLILKCHFNPDEITLHPHVLNQLIELTVDSSAMTDKAYRDILRQCPQLKILDIKNLTSKGAFFSDKSVKCNKLTEVSIKADHEFENQHLKELLSKSSNLQKLKLIGCPGIDQRAWPLEVRLKENFSLTLISMRIDDSAILALLKRCSQLVYLALADLPITGKTLNELSRYELEKLKTLSIERCKNIDSRALNAFLKKVSLQVFFLWHLSIDDSAFIDIDFELTSLAIFSCNFLTDQSVSHLVKSKKYLSRIELDGNAAISGEGLIPLSGNYQSLKTVILTSEKLSKTYLQQFIASCPVLERVKLGKLFDDSVSSIFIHSPAKVIHLADLPQLTTSDLLDLLQNNPKIEKLHLENLNITGVTFTKLSAPLHQLKKLQMDRCLGMTDTNLKILLKKTPNLENLTLKFMNIDGSALAGKEVILDRLKKLSMICCFYLKGNLPAIRSKFGNCIK